MFGFALSKHLGNKFRNSTAYKIISYDRNEELVRHLINYRTHLYYFRDEKIPSNVVVTNDLAELLEGIDIIVLAVPAQAVREVIGRIKEYPTRAFIIVNTAKALEEKTAKRLSEVIIEEMEGIPVKYTIAQLSGGTFASDIVKGTLLGADIACPNSIVCKELQRIFSNESLRIYSNDDLLGVEYAGAFKNVIAILAGLLNGLGLPYGSETHLISRAAKEVKELATSLGAKPKTFSVESQSWGNDLWMSCTGNSRNRYFGWLIGSGKKPEDAFKIMSKKHKLVEGYLTAKAIPILSKKTAVKTPILSEIYYVLYREKNLQEALHYLMNRELESIE